MSYEDTLEKVIVRLDREEKEKDRRIAELESDNKALIVEGDELDKRWISRDKRIAELGRENAELEKRIVRVTRVRKQFEALKETK